MIAIKQRLFGRIGSFLESLNLKFIVFFLSSIVENTHCTVRQLYQMFLSD